MAASDHLSGYQFRYHMPNNHEHEVTAHNEHGEGIGWLRWEDSQSTSMWMKPNEISALGVSNEYQRQGVATRMLQVARENGGDPAHSSRRTKAGDEWAKSVGGKRPPKKEGRFLNDMNGPPVGWDR
jgi:GNAT superfamily N-acetyltransferase